MIIGIDGNEANVTRRVGIGEYAFELLTELEHLQSNILNLTFQVSLKQRPMADLPKERKGWSYQIIGPKRLWTQIGLPLHLYLRRNKPDVFFTPTHYAPRFSPIPTVISIMDLSYIHYPQLFRSSDLYQLKHWSSYSVKKAKKILTISEASRNDIINEYKISPENVVVTYPGIKSEKHMKANVVDIHSKFSIPGRYILFVGTLQPRKNIVRLIQAFSILKKDQENEDLELVIVGKKGWLFEEILEAPHTFGVEDDVRFLEFVDDLELTELYKQAVCFVLPSLYEGFGLPVLEAMKYGCPVITSNVSSLPEAGGDAALYVDPTNSEDIAKTMQKVVENKGLQEQLREKGYKQVKKFSWEKTAKETLAVLSEVAQNK